MLIDQVYEIRARSVSKGLQILQHVNCSNITRNRIIDLKLILRKEIEMFSYLQVLLFSERSEMNHDVFLESLRE